MTSHLFHRTLKTTLPIASSASGSYITDETGKRYLDACGGAAVSCLGHNNANVEQAVLEQMRTLSYAHTAFFSNRPAEDLADTLIAMAPKGTGEGRVMFLGSGSAAMEAALKLARQYHLENGDAARTEIIARDASYHGNTLGALAIGGHKARRAPYEPILIKAHHIPACYTYRGQNSTETEAEYGLRMANTLEEKLQELGPERVAAFVAEPVVGAALGTVPAAQGYFKRIREICDQHGVLFIADEVMCGMGRTGSMFALEQEGIAADITTIAKGLGAGFMPIAAVIANESVSRKIETNSGLLWNGHTYMSHAVSCAAANTILNEIEQQQLMSNVQARGEELSNLLKQHFEDHANVGNIRGRGLFWSLEFVADKSSKQPFDTKLNVAGKIKQAALDNGLMCYPSQGCADGVAGDHVLLAPSYIVDSNELQDLISRLAPAVNSVLQSV